MKVEEISKVSKNDKTFYKLKIDGKSFTEFDSGEGFSQLEKEEVKSGYSAEVEFTETAGTFQNKAITYRNIVKFNKIVVSESSDKVVDNSMSKEDWANKDRRIVKQSCLSRAIELCELNKKEVVNDLITPDMVIKIAREFETKYVYGDGQ